MGDAPPELVLVVDFLNTRDLESGADILMSEEETRHWLDAHGWPTLPLPSTTERAHLKTLREGVRALAVRHNGGTGETEALDGLNAVLSSIPFHLREEHGALSLHTGAGGLLGQVADLLAEASRHPDFARLKACQNPSCRWAFYDASRNRSHRWCSMAACGSVIKSRRYRARQKPETAPEEP